MTKLSLLSLDVGFDPRVAHMAVVLPDDDVLQVRFETPDRRQTCQVTGDRSAVSDALEDAGYTVRFAQSPDNESAKFLEWSRRNNVPIVNVPDSWPMGDTTP